MNRKNIAIYLVGALITLFTYYLFFGGLTPYSTFTISDEESTKESLAALASAVYEYNRDIQVLDTDTNLIEIKGYIPKLNSALSLEMSLDASIDSWGNEIMYRRPSSTAYQMSFDIISAGPDSQIGTNDDIFIVKAYTHNEFEELAFEFNR